jgi:hypothetical protein
MKKSKFVSLVLITAVLASCQKEEPKRDQKKVYMRSDSTASYSHTHCHSNGWLWYYAFRPYGHYDGSSGSYHRAGFYSSGISENSNIGHSTTKSNAVRGGFGKSGFSVSS